MINAKDLPSLLTAPTSWTSQHVVIDGVAHWLTDTGGTWALTTDPSGVQVSQTVFNAIRSATVDNGGAGPLLLVNGLPREVIRVVALKKPWAILVEPTSP